MRKTLVITGGSRGIGLATVTHFMQQGWSVINLSRQPCPATAAISLSVDLQGSEWPTQISQRLDDELASSDQICLVHNAAFYQGGPVSTTSATTLRASFEINCIAPVLLNQLVLPHMKKGSAIIYIGSTLSEMGVANVAPYIMSKHALLGLMRAHCQELDNTGIHTCCICPGFTKTDMLLDHLQHDPAIIKAITDRVLAHRLVEPHEIAEFIYFCSQQPMINGAVLHANLGQKQQ